MILEKIKNEGLKYEFNVIFEANEIERKVSDEVLEKAKTFKMHGFRPGHVPLNIVRNSIEGSVLKNVLESLISEACDEILKQTGAPDFATRPIYRFDKEYESGADVSVVLSVEVAPSFDLVPFNCKVQRVIPKVLDEEVIQARNEFLDSIPVFEKTEKDYAVQNGDEVAYIATCYNKGVESKKKSFRNSLVVPMEIKENAEFLNNFLGKKVGDSFDYTPDENDKTIKYKFTIRTTKQRAKRPEAAKGGEALNDFDAIIKKQLGKEILNTAFIYHKNQILEYLKDQYDFPLPESILENETKNIIAEVKRDLAEREKETGEKQEAVTDDQIKSEYGDVVKQRVILGYVLNKIAQEGKIIVSNKELSDYLSEEIRRNPRIANQLMAYYKENPGAVEYKRAEIKERKVIDYLMTKVESTDVEMTKQEVQELVDKLLYEDDIDTDVNNTEQITSV
ncbi:MAG: hypothetical protein LBJ92_04190 [Holosporales bacterium]|jgi:trigger factor|nr:hypothetical protein [Holosporales bacterium]